jgi:hypothetical protein
MNWDLEEFKELCANQGLPDTKVYQATLGLKTWRAKNFGERSQKVWEDFISSKTESRVGDADLHTTSYRIEIRGGDEDLHTTWFESESYIEAALQALHSMADVLAQIINVVVLGGRFSEADVTMRKVRQQLGNLAPDVAASIQQLIDSEEFKYTNGFVNTIKHRRLLDTELSVEVGRGIKMGLRFQPFTYGQSFPSMWTSDIVENIIPRVIDNINAIGNALNDYLR